MSASGTGAKIGSNAVISEDERTVKMINANADAMELFSRIIMISLFRNWSAKD